MTILQQFTSKTGQLAVLIDPEKSQDIDALAKFVLSLNTAQVDYIFLGGSTGTNAELLHSLEVIKANTKLPVILFPGSPDQLSDKADGLLFLSLLSGRNPDYLIGHHVGSASKIWEMNLEVMSTGYLVLDSGSPTSVSVESKTEPMNGENHELIEATVKASILLGHKAIYLDGGSGATKRIGTKLLENVKAYCGVPLIVGGGIKSRQQWKELSDVGVNVIVIGNALEENPALINEFI
jgi:phosphoglycerol geranylgeranyltransferase